jgi:hypothetical protein
LSGSVQPLPSNLVSSSAQITAFGFISSSATIPAGTISGSAQITSFGFVSGSYETTGRGIISSSANLVTTSSFNSYTASISTASLVTSISNLNTFTASVSTASLVTSITNLNSFTASENTKASTLASYTASVNTTTSSLNAFTSSINSWTSSFSSSLASSITSVSGTFDNVIVNGQPTTYGVANLTTGVVAIQATATGTMNATVGKVTLSNSYSQVVGASSPGTTIFTLPTLQPGTYLITAQAKVTSGYSVMGIFTGGSQVANTSVFSWYQASGTVNNGLQGTWVLTVTTPTVYTINAWGGGTVSAASDGAAVANYIQINPTFALNTLNTMQISGSLTTTGSITSLGGITGQINATNGVISGSSQLTASYDTRYTLSGSVVSGTTPAGTISGSSQLTSSFDGRYVQTGSFNTLTTSFNSFTASAQSVTTGSNTFIGTQTITGSLNISGPTTLSGSVTIGPGGGSEGGEIALAYAPSGNTLTGSAVSVDVYQNRLRIFEGGGNSRGVYIDLSKAPNGVAGELLYKASGFVNAGVDVTLGNLKARIPTSGYRSLQVSTVSGTYSVYGSSVYSYNGIGGITVPSGTPVSVTTTPTYLSAGYNFIVAGSTDTWNIMDTSAGIAWRITMIIGDNYLNNFISIERLF